MPKATAAEQMDAYIAMAAPYAQPILNHLRAVVWEAVPDVEEAIKWSRPFFVYHGIILGNMAAFKEHCSFGLWGTEIVQKLRQDGVASSDGMGTFGRITSLHDLPPRSKLLRYVREAAKKIDDGARTKSISRPKVAKGDVVVPDALLAALKKSKAAQKNFEAMSTSCRREYSEWIADAKREETRDKRIATALEWIAEGKPRHWKYQA